MTTTRLLRHSTGNLWSAAGQADFSKDKCRYCLMVIKLLTVNRVGIANASQWCHIPRSSVITSRLSKLSACAAI